MDCIIQPNIGAGSLLGVLIEGLKKYPLEKPELPLSAMADRTYFKLYMSDIGLFKNFTLQL